MAEGCNWNDYPAFFKRDVHSPLLREAGVYRGGTTTRCRRSTRPGATRLLAVERTECVPLEMPPLVKVGNRAGVLFRRRGCCDFERQATRPRLGEWLRRGELR